ncbi:hypothetical protein MP228_006437 [Amoeboaphelidium protococcarum]|nr:hypothetical protein MP228_006437 [Amoeboaphelidium protococcarum]
MSTSHFVSVIREDLSNARESPLMHTSTHSSAIDSGVASHLLLSSDGTIDFNAELLQNVPSNQRSAMDYGLQDVETYLSSLSSLQDQSEIQDTQPQVIKLLEHILKVLKVDGYSWVKGKEIPRNTGFEAQNQPLMPRVFCPRYSVCDIMLQKIGRGDIIGPIAEVKLDSLLQNDLSALIEKPARQAALYGISFILRVYPMLPADVVTEIFGSQWHFYVPLLSHKSLYMIRIDLNSVYNYAGIIEVQRSIRCFGRDMAVMLSSWVLWAMQVQRSLVEHSTDILQPRARYCWIPPGSVQTMLPHVKASQLIARPSFYNPLYVDQKNKRVYKLYSVWTGNPTMMDSELLRDSELCQGWKDKSSLLSMPWYEGDDLHKRPPSGLSQLKDVLLQLVEQLSRLSQEHKMCHCDIRAANICWKSDDKIVLIDYDLAIRFGVRSLKLQEARDSAPEIRVTERYDMWLLGVMVFQWTTQKFNWQFVINRKQELAIHVSYRELDGSEIVWKEQFTQHSNTIHKIVENCLQLQNNRWSLQDLKFYLHSLN